MKPNSEDKEIMEIQRKVTTSCREIYKNLPPEKQAALAVQATRIANKLSPDDNGSRLTMAQVLTVFLSALYFAKFGESPVETALRSRKDNANAIDTKAAKSNSPSFAAG